MPGRLAARGARPCPSPHLNLVVSKQPPDYFFIGDNSADLAFDPADLPDGALDAAEIVHAARSASCASRLRRA